MIFLLGLLVSLQASAAEPTPDEIGRRVFLGEAYPSGNAYLQRFRPAKRGASGEAQELPKVAAKDAPELVMAFGLVADSEPLQLHREGPAGEEYLPAKEGMDASHNEPCKLSVKPGPKRQYADGSDFFDSVFDNCSFAEAPETLRYEGAPLDSARQILASNLYLRSFDRSRAKRPLSEAEKKQVAAAKKAFENEKADCSTEPAYLDSATRLVQAEVEGTSLSLRVSSFDDPGCGGHLTTIYVLDVLRAGKLEKSFLLYHYRGLI